MTPGEAKEISEATAEATVIQLFLRLGYDIKDKEQLRLLKQDLGHLRRWREATDTIGKQSIAAAVTVIIAAILGGAWLTFQMLVRGGPTP